jgi:hypothetical protein
MGCSSSQETSVAQATLNIMPVQSIPTLTVMPTRYNQISVILSDWTIVNQPLIVCDVQSIILGYVTSKDNKCAIDCFTNEPFTSQKECICHIVCDTSTIRGSNSVVRQHNFQCDHTLPYTMDSNSDRHSWCRFASCKFGYIRHICGNCWNEHIEECNVKIQEAMAQQEQRRREHNLYLLEEQQRRIEIQHKHDIDEKASLDKWKSDNQATLPTYRNHTQNRGNDDMFGLVESAIEIGAAFGYAMGGHKHHGHHR